MLRIHITEITLPQTRIRCFISTRPFRILAGEGNGHGVLPIHPVNPDIKDILSGEDIAKKLALKLASEH